MKPYGFSFWNKMVMGSCTGQTFGDSWNLALNQTPSTPQCPWESSNVFSVV